MNKGILWVAPVGTPWPTNTVTGGAFVATDWQGTPWTALGAIGQVVIDTKATNRDATITVEWLSFTPPPLPFFARPVSGPPPAAVPRMAVAIENMDRTQRLFLDQATFNATMPMSRKSSSKIIVTFHAEIAASTGRPWTLFIAGKTTRLPSGFIGTISATTSAVAPSTPPSTTASGVGSLDLVPGRLRGYREWRMKKAAGPRPPMLQSITAHTVWAPTPMMRARCERDSMRSFGPRQHDPDDAPQADCSCGIYAKHEPIAWVGNAFAAGVVEMWGRIQIGTSAMRSEYARLVALCAPSTPYAATMVYETITQLGEYYRVPIFNSPQLMYDAYPPSDISALLAEEPEPTES